MTDLTPHLRPRSLFRFRESGELSKIIVTAFLGKKATTVKMRLSKMLFFLGFRPTIKFQGGSPVDPCFEPPADPPFDSTSQKLFLLGEAKPGCFQTRVLPTFFGNVQIVSRTLSGLFLVGALNRLRKRKRTNRENPRTIPAQIGKIPEKSGKSEKGQKRKDKSRSGNPPV